MKKIITILLIGIFTSCGISKEINDYNSNLLLLQTEYPKAKITQHRRFTYVFKVDSKNESFYVVVSNNGKITKAKKIR